MSHSLLDSYEGPAGFWDEMGAVLGNGDRILAFVLSSRATRGTSPKFVGHTGWLTQDRLLDVWPISHSDYLCKIDPCAEKDLIEAM